MSADIPAVTPVDITVVGTGLDLAAQEAKNNQAVIDAVSSGQDTEVKLLFGQTEVPADAKEKFQAHAVAAGSGILGVMLGVETDLIASKSGGKIVDSATAEDPKIEDNLPDTRPIAKAIGHDETQRLMRASTSPNNPSVDSNGKPLTAEEDELRIALHKENLNAIRAEIAKNIYYFDVPENREAKPRIKEFGEVADVLRRLEMQLAERKVPSDDFNATVQNIFANFNEYVGFEYEGFLELKGALGLFDPNMTTEQLQGIVSSIEGSHKRTGSNAMIRR